VRQKQNELNKNENENANKVRFISSLNKDLRKESSRTGDKEKWLK